MDDIKGNAANNIGYSCKQRELVKAVDTLSRENSSLRQKLKEQATETEALREALQRREREYQDRHLSRTLSKPFANFGRRISASQEAAL